MIVRFLSNLQGGHKIMNLMTGQVIKRRQVTMIPMTLHIIECVHKLAQSEKMPEGMKVTSKTGVILYDNSWLPGVQYESTDERYAEYLEKMTPDDEDDNSEEVDVNDLYEIVGMKHVEEQQMSRPEEENNEDIEINHGIRNEEIQELTNEEEVNESDNTEEIQHYNDDIGGIVTRSGRRVKPVIRTNLLQHDLPGRGNGFIEYGEESSKVIAQVIHKFNITGNKKININKYGLLQTYNLKQGFHCYGERRKEAASDEMKQLHARGIFLPVKMESLTDKERERDQRKV